VEPAQRDALRAQLKALHAELSASLTGAGDRAGTVDLDQSAVGRLSRVDALQQQAMAQAQERRLELRLKTVVNALARVETDRFGECLRCGEDIPERRLRARPEAPFCLACTA